MPVGWVDFDIFLSYRPRRIYQYSMEYEDLSGDWSTEIVERDSFDKLSYLSLQHAFEEATGGVNTKWNFDRSSYLGFVGWAGKSHFTLGSGIDARFRDTFTCLNAHSTALWGSTVDGLALSMLSQAKSL